METPNSASTSLNMMSQVFHSVLVWTAMVCRSPGMPTARNQLPQRLFLEGDPAGAATALGLSQAIRGTFDHGDTELRTLAEVLAERLGRTDFDIAHQRGAGTTPREATDRLTRKPAAQAG
jgi:hypothetical protein